MRTEITLPSLTRKNKFWLGLAAAFSLGTYLVANRLVGVWGFPLDDAWIHQTYARNLAQLGGWAFVPGVPSAGSTAPLWSALLAPGYPLGLGPYAWTFILGWLLLWAVALQGERFFRIFQPGKNRIYPSGIFANSTKETIPWGGMMLVFEWHLVWAGGSGMETLLMTWMVLFILVRTIAEGSGKKPWFFIGSMIGLSGWVRPDGITLLGLAGMVILISRQNNRDRLRCGMLCVLGFSVAFLPYLFFNRLLAGAWWPNTFYAKQSEYAIYQQIPYFQRLAQQTGQLLVGVGLITLPGFMNWLVGTLLRRRAWTRLAAIAWMLGYIGLYAWRLPVTYQHARYIIPAMPVFLLCGLAGMIEWVQHNASSAWRRIANRAWMLLGGITLLAFWLLGMRAYSQDVRIIETNMVAAAKWIALNTRPGDLIAAHDIGALGFFGDRKIIDLAGLVSPEVIPIIRDETAIAHLLDEQEADYLMTFPGWYPQLVNGKKIVYESASSFEWARNSEAMVIYRWRDP